MVKKEEESYLTVNNEFFQHLIENVNDLVQSINKDGKFVYVNQKWRETLRYSEDDLKKLKLTDVLHPDHLQKCMEIFKKVCQGESIEGVRTVFIAKNGDEIPVEGNIKPIIKNNRFIATCGVFRDISKRLKVEKLLRESENKFKAIFENMSDIVVYLDTKGTILDVNNRIKDVLGYRPEEIIGKNFAELKVLGVKEMAKIVKLFKKSIRERKIKETVELELNHKNGKKVIVEVKTRFIKNNGKIKGVVNVIRDVTEQRKAISALEESERRYRNLVELCPYGIIIHRDGEILYANDAILKLVGVESKEKVIGKNVLDYIHPDYKEKAILRMKKIQSGEYAEPIEQKVLLPNGKEMYLEVTGIPFVYEGEPAAQIIIKDITDKKKAEKEIKESENLLKTIINNLNAGFVIIDAKTHEIVRCNIVATKLIGLPEEEITGKICHEFICPAINGKCPITDLKHTIDNSEHTLLNSNREEIPILKKAVLINANGHDYIVESFVDISERKKMEETLHELNEVLRLLNKNLRHDILNDLTVVGNYLELYNETKDKKLLDSAFKSIKKSVELIKRMRELESLITSGNNLKPLDIRKILEDLARNYNIQIHIKGNGIALADDALISVFDNIIRNAVVHGNANEIEIRVENRDNMCEIRIADNGTGIPDEIKNEIFEEGFSYGDRGGSGLGLYIVKKTVERYGGSVSIEDNKPKGTVFVIKLRPSIPIEEQNQHPSSS